MREILKKKQPFMLRYLILLGLVLAAGAIWFSLKSVFPTKEIRHVILISIDALRADHLSCYNYPQKITPRIDALAQESILFENVVTPFPLTLPAHCSMLTGTIPPYHRVNDNLDCQLGNSNITLAEILKDNGFTTAAVVSSFILNSDTGIDQGFDTYIDDYVEVVRGGFDVGRRAEETSRLASEWLERHQNEKFFLFLHYFDPHTPYDPPEPFDSAFPDNPYVGETAYTDKYIGELIKKLKDLDLYDSTLLIITADHGEMLGEHGETEHGFFIYESAIKVPLIVKVPGINKGSRIDAPVSLVDIVPMICGSLGLTVPSHVQGENIAGCFADKDKASEDRYIFCESLYPTKYGGNSLLGLLTGRWKYIQTTRPELYDLGKDLLETNNLVDEQPHRARLLREHLKLILEEQSYKDRDDNVLVSDSETRKRLESLGYVSGGTVQEDYSFDQSKTDPKDLITLFEQHKKVNAFMRTKEYEKAKSLCAEMVAENPEHLYTRFRMGQVAFEAGDLDGAILHFSELLARVSDKLQALPDEDIMRTFYVHKQLAEAFFRQNKFEQTVVHLRKALAIKPNEPTILYNMGTALLNLGNADEAIKYWTDSLRIDPDQPGLHNALGELFYRQGKFDEAVRHCETALRLQPNWPEVHYNLGNVLLRQNKLEKAIMHYSQSLLLKPSYDKARQKLQEAKTRRSQQKIEELIASWNESLLENPNQPELHKNLGNAFYKQGNFEKTIHHWTMVLQLKPDSPDLLNNLAWLLATQEDDRIRNPAKAIQLARRACELTDFKQPSTLDTLSVAYAAAGKFPDAVETAQKAIELAESTNQQQLADKIKKRLELYKSDQPYHD